MSDATLVVETKDGEEYVGDIETFRVEIDQQEYGADCRIEYREYLFRVGELLQTN